MTCRAMSPTSTGAELSPGRPAEAGRDRSRVAAAGRGLAPLRRAGQRRHASSSRSGSNYRRPRRRDRTCRSPRSRCCSPRPSAACQGPNDPVMIPTGSLKTDWEVELGVVIGTRASYVDEAEALDHVAGYVRGQRRLRARTSRSSAAAPGTRARACDTFGPVGPWMVTSDEVGDPQNLGMWLDVNGQRKQDGSTKTMIFPIGKLVSYLSEFMTLEPGDLITTGTPPGVGMGQKPEPVYLKAGDEIAPGHREARRTAPDRRGLVQGRRRVSPVSSTVYANRFAGRAAGRSPAAPRAWARPWPRASSPRAARSSLWDLDADGLEGRRDRGGRQAHRRPRRLGRRRRPGRRQGRQRGPGPHRRAGRLGRHHRRDGPVHEYPIDSWQRVIDINLNGVFYCCTRGGAVHAGERLRPDRQRRFGGGQGRQPQRRRLFGVEGGGDRPDQVAGQGTGHQGRDRQQR